MSINPGHFGTVSIGLIAGGDINDKPSDQSCNQKVFLPMEHSPDGVKLEHLAFSPLQRSPDKDTQQSFPGTHDPGTLVYVLKLLGSNQCLILGQANDLFNSDNRTPGNMDLLNNPIVNELFNRKIGIRIPPNIEEKTLEDGTKVRAMKEKGEEWSHSLTRGLPTHASLFSIVGFFNPEIRDVPTAKQHFNEMPTTEMMNKLPGDIMSLGKMLKGLLGGGGAGGASPIAGLSPQLQNAVASASTLIQDFEGTAGSSTLFIGDRVHANTYMNNAANLISQITCVDDLMTVLHRLRWDDSLFGQDQLEPVEFTIDTAWGEATQILQANGNVTIQYANSSSIQEQNDFANQMASPSASPSVSQDSNMFGGSAKTMFDMFKRMAPEAEKESKKMSSKLNTEDLAKKLNEIVKKTIKGGNPLSPDLFK